MTDALRPPAHIAMIVDALGQERAILFLLEFGGGQLTVSRRPTGRSRVADVIGIDGAASIAEIADTLPRRIPTAKPWIARVWAAGGMPVDEISRRLHVANVAVNKWLKDPRTGERRPGRPRTEMTDPRQLRLF